MASGPDHLLRAQRPAGVQHPLRAIRPAAFYEPDLIVRLRNGVYLVLEIKGQPHDDTDAKHLAANRWVSAVNRWGRLGAWDFLVCRDSQRLGSETGKLVATGGQGQE